MDEQPLRSRPKLQRDYGVPDNEAGMLTWEAVEAELSKAANYWIATIDPTGPPQTTPVWAIWREGRLYFSCGFQTAKARNLRRNPLIAIHLESAYASCNPSRLGRGGR